MTNYILEYYQKIKDGSLIVGEYIKALYEIIIKGLEDKVFFYDPKKAKAAIVYIENYVRHHEGPLAPQKLKLELWEKAMISAIFGIVDDKGFRQFREVFIVIARKNGKTLLAAAIASYCTFCDGEYGGQVYFTAPKLEQANLCFNAFYQTITKDATLNKLAKKRRSDVYVESSNTTAKPIAFSAKKSDGFNVSLGICDEIASWQGAAGLKFYEVLKSSVGARTQPLLLSITTAGYENEGIYDELYARSTRYLKGESGEHRLLPFLYVIDDPRKWNDINELYKSNPNLGVSVSVDYMLEEIAIAEGSLSKKAEFLVKYTNTKQNSSTAWLNAIDIARASEEDITLEQFRHSYAVCGIDLSRTTDLTAATCVIEKNGELYCFAKFFLPAERIQEASAKDGLPYDIYIKKGWLVPSGENFVDYKDCTNWLLSLVKEYEILPLQIGYDRYSAQYLIQELKDIGFQTDDVFQGYNLTPVINEFEGLLKDKKIHIGNNDLLKVHLLNAALKRENETERCKLVKIGQLNHIDGAAALLDAFCVRQKWYGDIGRQLQNK